MEELEMFVTNTDWEFADVDSVTSAGEQIWPVMKAAGATSFTVIQTGETSGRTTAPSIKSNRITSTQ